jgi:hypothetical protein
MEKQDEFVEHTDLGTYLGELSRRLLLRGEMLRGIGHLWGEYDSTEGAEIAVQLGVELGQIGQQLKLLRNQLCQDCQIKELTEIITFGQSGRNE